MNEDYRRGFEDALTILKQRILDERDCPARKNIAGEREWLNIHRGKTVNVSDDFIRKHLRTLKQKDKCKATTLINELVNTVRTGRLQTLERELGL